ncbi:MAG TPA: hypothetical protein GXZ76_04930 [Clostridiaceae bacterium]|nr:hypothetical protein [Clostridiaceae bacterium]
MFVYTVISLLFRIFVLVGLGFLLKKINMIDDKVQQGLTNLLINVALPASLLSSSSNSFEPEMANEIAMTAIVSILYFVLSSLIFTFVLRKLPFKMSRDKQNIFIALVIYSNISFMGYPIVANLLGPKATILAVIHSLIWNLYFFTVGVSTIKGENAVSIISIIKKPVTLSALLTLIIYFLPISLPAVIYMVLNDIGGMTTPISMMLIGVTLGGIKLSKSLFRDSANILAAVFRLLIIPISAIFLFKVFKVPELVSQTIVLMLAMPSGSMVAIHASLFDKEAEFATRGVSLNTTLFALTFPLILFLMNL